MHVSLWIYMRVHSPYTTHLHAFLRKSRLTGKDVCHVCDASLVRMSVTSVGGGAGGGCKFLPLNTSTLLLDRVSQNLLPIWISIFYQIRLEHFVIFSCFQPSTSVSHTVARNSVHSNQPNALLVRLLVPSVVFIDDSIHPRILF
jgi:hypothetical protein